MEVSPFSDIYTVLSISECERGFSCMSRVKTTLRNRLTNTILQGLMMVSIHGPDDSEFDFRTAMNIWGKLRKRHILVEKAKESTEKSKLLKKIVMKSLLLRERIKRHVENKIKLL